MKEDVQCVKILPEKYEALSLYGIVTIRFETSNTLKLSSVSCKNWGFFSRFRLSNRKWNSVLRSEKVNDIFKSWCFRAKCENPNYLELYDTATNI